MSEISPELAAEFEDLLQDAREISAMEKSPWQPPCIARAFRTQRDGEIAITMQQWIDLDAMRSPFVIGEVPTNLDDLRAAFDALELDLDALEPEEAADATRAILRACDAMFTTSLAMRDPRSKGADTAPDGFGSWLPIYACLVTTCRVDPNVALGLRVDRSFAIIAGHRRNEGWEVAGQPYALRDVATEITENTEEGRK